MHRPFQAVPAVLAVISLLIPAEGPPRRCGKPEAPQGSFVDVENGKIYYDEWRQRYDYSRFDS